MAKRHPWQALQRAQTHDPNGARGLLNEVQKVAKLNNKQFGDAFKDKLVTIFTLNIPPAES